MNKNDIYLGSASKQNAPFSENFSLKNALMLPISE